MYAVIKSGGKQYRVKKGDFIDVELLKDTDVGAEVNFNVLFISDEEVKEIGCPVLDNYSVKGVMRDVVKGDKVRALKQKKRSSSQTRRFGHRQQYARVEILDIVRS